MKVKGFQSKISNIHASWKDKELELRLNAEAGLQKQFEFKMVRAVEIFREEITGLKGQHKLMKQEQAAMTTLVFKMERMVSSAENQISRMKMALTLGDIEKLYDTLKVGIPKKIKMAMWLVMQFESSDFNFDVIYNEEKLQEHYEMLEDLEIEEVRQKKLIE